MQKAVDFIRQNYASDITIKDAAGALHVSESYLMRLFRQECGCTFNDYLTNYRIKQACLLLSDPQVRVYEVAEKVGYKSQQYFAVVFKKIVGKTPGEFKERGI
ncbi:MAG TPA: AraC family transcriptional regulator [Candidatus Avimonas sp.]|nr:AraC family transcriptional regulator [Candidatus Avimonas sp.]